MTTAAAKFFDIIINGGGIAGLTLAGLLRDSGLQVAVIERQPLLPLSDEPELRVSAIGRASLAVFERCGALHAMLDARATPFREMHVWDSAGAGEIHFDSAEAGLDTLGYIIENNRIQHALLQSAQAADNVTLLCPAVLEGIQREQDAIQVTLENGECLQARLLVGADGFNSPVRRFAAIDYPLHSYRQKALVCAVATELPHQHTAWQIFLPGGPLAFLPLFASDGRDQCSIVWSLPESEADCLLALDEPDFEQRLQQAFEYRLGDVRLTSPRAAFPLRHGHAAQTAQANLALIGDAAHIIHPLAGQGANLGILDAAELADVIASARGKGRQWWAQHTLRRYERARKGETLMMETAMSGFNLLFSNDNAWLAMLRNAGLNLVDHAPALKQQFMRVTGARG